MYTKKNQVTCGIFTVYHEKANCITSISKLFSCLFLPFSSGPRLKSPRIIMSFSPAEQEKSGKSVIVKNH